MINFPLMNVVLMSTVLPECDMSESEHCKSVTLDTVYGADLLTFLLFPSLSAMNKDVPDFC